VHTIRHIGSAACAAALTTVLAGALAACGSASPSSSSASPSNAGSPSAGSSGAGSAGVSPTASSDPLAGLSADDIATQAWADTKAAVSVHVAGSGTDSGKPLKFSLTLVKGKGCTGTMTEGTGGSVTIVMIAKTVWIKPDDMFWKANGGNDPATLAILSGKYIKDAAGTGLGAMSSLCNLSNWAGSSAQPTDMVKGGKETVDGQLTLRIKDSGDSAAAFVSDTPKPVVVRVVDPSSNGGTFDFTDYGAATTLTAPSASQTLDGAKYGL